MACYTVHRQSNALVPTDITAGDHSICSSLPEFIEQCNRAKIVTLLKYLSFIIALSTAHAIDMHGSRKVRQADQTSAGIPTTLPLSSCAFRNRLLLTRNIQLGSETKNPRSRRGFLEDIQSIKDCINYLDYRLRYCFKPW
jgi:hypothetical protein